MIEIYFSHEKFFCRLQPFLRLWRHTYLAQVLLEIHFKLKAENSEIVSMDSLI